MRYTGKVAVVTGGTSGIGAAIASRLAEEGASVIITGTNADKGNETEEAMRSRALIVKFHRMDVAVEAEAEACIQEALRVFGRLDVAVNCAGIFSADITDLTNTKGTEWDRVLAVNLTGAFYCMKYEIPAISRSGGGAIVNIASGAGIRTLPGASAYVASKHGLIGLSKNAAVEAAPQNVRINVVAPGMVRTPILDGTPPDIVKMYTDQNAMGRIGETEEIASAVAWICSAEASFTTGVVLPVDGGYCAK